MPFSSPALLLEFEGQNLRIRSNDQDNLHGAQRAMQAALLAPLENGQCKSAAQSCAACSRAEMAHERTARLA